MKIAVIGGGVSGVTFAINRKRNHPKDEIFIFEHSDKLLKKILATGNGKCNIANNGDLSNIYNSPIAIKILEKYNFSYQNSFLDSLNIKTKLVGALSYPISESAVTVRNAFLKEIERLGIEVIYNANITEYYKNNNGYIVKADKDYCFDKIVFAIGGKSLPKSGSDGSLYPLLKKHGYQIKEFNPALCPIYTKEKTKILDGTRVKAKVTLLCEGKTLFVESGEVLFKERGLSGIVIFNLSRIIAANTSRKYTILLDLLPDISKEELLKFAKNHNKETVLESYLHPNLVKYLMGYDNYIDAIKSLEFNFDKLYGFENAQISVGGITLNEIDESLMSKKEKGIYFAGEMLDVDAPCGGYNLMWAIGSALYLSDKIN